jgi:hypothetical protein
LRSIPGLWLASSKQVILRGPSLVGATATAKITLVDRSGKTVTQTQLQFPDVPYIQIKDISVSSTGRIAVAGTGRNNDRQANFIAWLTSGGSVEFVVRTDPFMAEKISFLSDGTLWAFGGLNRRDVHDLLRHYDGKGVLVGSSMSSRDFLRDKGLHPSAGAMMTATDDRVGILSKYANAWVEISPADGSVIGRWSLPSTGIEPFSCGVAITRNGDTYIALQNTLGSCLLFRLDKAAEKWVLLEGPDFVARPPKTWIQIIGNDGDNIVMTNDWQHYFVVRPPSPGVAGEK